MTPEGVEKLYARTAVYHRASRARRHDRINEYKMSKGCIDCGYADNPVALDFDHRNPELKTFGVAAMLTYSWANILAELDKCDVRCANCHRIRTQLLGQSQYRRRPASSQTEDGPSDEILRTTSQVSSVTSHRHHLPRTGVPTYILDSARHMRST